MLQCHSKPVCAKTFIFGCQCNKFLSFLFCVVYFSKQGFSNIKEIMDRYFIVVDDIWDVKTWDIIKCAFPGTSSGSRIITTTRVKDVAHSCCSSLGGHVHNIRPLNLEYSRQLFHRRLFNYEEELPSDLQEIADEILKKCDGLPLAIIAISGLLGTRKSTKEEWDQVKNSIGCALERNAAVEGMIQILSLSYFDLPPHLKTCLLYLSIFPEDYVIEKKDLIRKWIAEGFICREGKYTAYEVGERCFNELINRSLIQPKDTNKYDEVKTCRVHDIILDFIITKSIEENFVTLPHVPNQSLDTQRKVRRISVQFVEDEDSDPTDGLVLSHLRSYNLFVEVGKPPGLDRCSHLRLLHVRGSWEIGNYIFAETGRLFQLRYMNLRNTGVTEIPEQIGDLRCLELLDLRGTWVVKLPESIVNLQKLVYLFVDRDAIFPVGISKMESLEVLKHIGVLGQSLSVLLELGQMKNLRKLFLDFVEIPDSGDENEVTKESMKAVMSSVHNLCLCTLVIKNDVNFLVEKCCPPLSLQKLEVYSGEIPYVPYSVGSLINLQKIFLWMGRVELEDLRILGALPAVLILRLVVERKTRIKSRVVVSGADGFSCLRMFCYVICAEGMNLMFAAGSMPKLEKIDIAFNADEMEPLTGCDFDFGTENLRSLARITCKVFGSDESGHAAKAALERAANTHHNHPILKVGNHPASFFKPLVSGHVQRTSSHVCKISFLF